MREVLDKPVEVVDVLLVFVSQRLLQTDIQIEGKAVLLVDFVQYYNLFLKLGIGLVVVLNNRGEGSVSESERDHSYEHHY